MAGEGDSGAAPPGRHYVRACSRRGRLSRATKFFQAIGALPDTFKNFAFGTFLLFFYNQILGLPAFVASVALAAALILDAACDPLIGSFSDNLRTRLGRRHPLMYASAVPLAAGLYLAFSPPSLSHEALALWLFASVAITNISMSLFLVPWTALYAEFSDDFDERTEIVVWRSAVSGVGGLAVAYLTYGVIFPSNPAFRAGQLNPAG
ncbi:MAG: MFS transporter [Caulobacteraceae bacterium]|nr:MFS transporter [Caulobacteraceae bacterium]